MRSRAGARFCGGCGTGQAALRPGLRKTVTVVFVDARALPHAELELRVRQTAAFYDQVRGVLEAHGGTVERHVGDAVMAVFGVPTTRDDDVLRASSAGLAVVEAFRQQPEGPQVRVGINTGEVLTGDGSQEQTLAVGDPVVVAARLQQRASPSEVLLGPETVRQLGARARLGAPRTVVLRGRSGLFRVAPLLGLGSGPGDGSRGPFVGRDAECRIIRAALDRSGTAALGQLVSVFGEAGTGKSRLVREVVSGLGSDRLVLTASCRGWGAGAAWRPLVDILQQISGLPALSSPQALVERLISERPALTPVLPLLATLFEGEAVPVGGPDLGWAVATVLDDVARSRPVVLVLDDLHLAAPALLDLLPEVLRRLESRPVAVVGVSRPELLEGRPEWGARLRHVVSLTLRPLPEGQARQLAEAIAPDEAAVNDVVAAAGGNPLFLTQLARARAEGSDVADLAGLTVATVLAVRLDALALPCRQVLERAALVGSRGRIADLRPLCEGELELSLEAELRRLARRDLLEVSDDDAWAFTSELVREAAVAGLSREDRADLHRVRGLVLAVMGSTAEAGHHLEQASRLLRLSDPERSASLAQQAASRLAAAGLGALGGDLAFACDLLRRATDLMPTGQARRLSLLPDLARGLVQLGDLPAASAVLEHALAVAQSLGLEQAVAHAELARIEVLRSAEPALAYAELPRLLAAVLPILDKAQDDRGLCLAYQLRASELQHRMRWAAMEHPLALAMHHAHRTGDRRLLEVTEGLQVASLFHGPAHTDEVHRRLLDLLDRPRSSPSCQALLKTRLAVVLALKGDPGAGREVLASAQHVLHDLGRELPAWGAALVSGQLELLAQDPQTAVEVLDRALKELERLGDHSLTSRLAVLLAEAHWQCEDPSAAQAAVDRSRRAAVGGDVLSASRWRSVQAKLLALHGRSAEALASAAAAADLVATTDELLVQADVLADTAQVHELLSNPAAAQIALTDAVHRYDRKGAPQAIRLLGPRITIGLSAALQPQASPDTAAGALPPVVVEARPRDPVPAPRVSRRTPG